jgi:dTDP-4-dehydrorhamnose 3,5-epimerase
MKFTNTELAGAMIIELEAHQDERGFFARTFCAREFAAQGLNPNFVQANLSLTRKAGTLRGMHYQIPPAAETKLVRCLRGAIYDVIVDLRPDSATYLSWTSIELTEENHLALYIPEGFAHGFQTLSDDVEVFYQMGDFFTPDCQRGILYNDPTLAITWPLPIGEISAKDATLPVFSPSRSQD